MTSDPRRPVDDEPAYGPWTGASVDDLAVRIEASAGSRDRIVVAVDGRSAGGKSTLAARLVDGRDGWSSVATDDLAWWHSFFRWDGMLREHVLEPYLRGEAVAFRPSAWEERGRPGAVEVPPGTRVLVLEGVGAARRSLADLMDVVVWVHTPFDEVLRREDERIASGVTDAEFSREWLTEEARFLADERPWVRAQVVVAGTAGPEGEIRLAVDADERASDSRWAAPVRALLLDVDDTLVDTRSAMRSSCTVGAAAARPELSPEIHEQISDWFYDDPGGYFDAYTRGEFPFDQMRAARYHEACRRLGLSETGFDVFEAAYREAFARSQILFDDAVRFLDAARDAGVAVAFVTNSGREQTEVKLAAVGLQGRGVVVTTDTLGVGKPDPVMFEHALGLLGERAEDALVVGDTLHTDVMGAQAAGIRAAWLQRPGLPEPRNAGWGTPIDDPGVRVVASLDDVAVLLQTVEPEHDPAALPQRRPRRAGGGVT